MKLGGGIEASNVRYGEDSLEVKVQAAMPTDATPTDAILKDEDGYIISGKWECENGIVVELADNMLTISGNGVLGEDVRDIIISVCKIGKYNIKCIINYGITAIPNYMFSGGVTAVSNLSSIEIPDSVISIGDEAFGGCRNLKKVKMSSNVTSIGDGAFSGCLSLESIEIPDGVTSIGDMTFNTCTSLKEIKIPDGVTSIGNSAFYRCYSLKEIKIPNSVTNIGHQAFARCTGLSEIEIPNSVISIGNLTFFECSNLIKITNNSSTTFNLDSLTDQEKSGQWYLENTNTIVIGIHNGETAIYRKTYEAIPTDTILKDENGYIISGKWECNNVITIELIDNVFTINGKDKLTQGVRDVIVNTACKSDKYKVKCIINNGITEIPENLFLDCKGLTEIEISNSVTNIGYKAFSGCSNLSSIEIPSSVTKIGFGAFLGCDSLNNIKILEGLTIIEKSAFSGCNSLNSIEIPSSVTNIGEDAFKNCNSLSCIKVAEGNKVYDSRDNCNAIIMTETNELIRGCDNTKIPGSVTSIGYSAFEGCNGLTTIEIPNSVVSIKADAFSDCSNLKSIEIPETVTRIMYGVVSGCSNLKSIKVAENNKVYDSRENCNAIIMTETNILIAGCGNTKIPNSVTGIGDSAFYNCSSLTSIEIPSSVTKIELGKTNPFDGCKNLKRFTNNSSVDYFLNRSIHGYDDNGQWYLENTDTIIDKIANGQTAIYKKIGEDVKYGDINSDGEINIQDGVLLKKHLAGIKGLNIDMTASDVNVDGEVNIQDAVILIKHLAGMNVTMGKE